MDKRISLSLIPLLFASVNSQAAPVAVDDVRSVPVNNAITIDVLNNDSDSNGLTPQLDPTSVTQPANGTITVNADGGITYVPNTDYIGQDSFSYTIFTSDGEVVETATASVIITVTPNVGAGNLVGPNMTSVASAVEQVCARLANYPGGELSGGSLALQMRCEELRALAAADPEAAAQAMRQIAPEETLSLSKVGVNAQQFQSNVVGARLMQLGQGLTQINTGGLGWSGQLSGQAAGDDSILAKIGLFTSLQLEDADKDHTIYESGFDYSAFSLTAGADYALTPRWFIGGAVGYTGNQLDYKDKGGEVSANILSFIGYSSFDIGNFNLDVQAGFGNSDIELEREISYGTYDGMFTATTAGTTNGSQWFVSTELQYLLSFKALTLFPSIKFNYMDSSVDSYADTDAGGWDVVLGEQNVTQSTLELGLQATFAINTSWGVLVPNAEVRMYDDLDTDQELVSGYFAYAPGDTVYFGMWGEEPDGQYFQGGLGFSMVMPRGFSAFLGYHQIFAYEDYSASQIQAGLRFEL